MVDAIINFFRELLNNDILTIFIISMIPVVELRGAIPVAIEMGLSWYEAFGYAFLGSIVVAPILLLILMPILKAMKKIKAFRWLANAVEELFKSKAESVKNRAKKADSKKTEDLIKMVGVFLFVAIPLPLTGVWTGTAVAVFLGLGFWKSLVSVAVGNVSAGLIMTGLSLLFKDNLNIFLTVFLIVVVVVLVANLIYVVVKSKLKKKKAANENVEQNAIDTIADNMSCEDESKIDNVNNSSTTDSDAMKINNASIDNQTEKENSDNNTGDVNIKKVEGHQVKDKNSKSD